MIAAITQVSIRYQAQLQFISLFKRLRTRPHLSPGSGRSWVRGRLAPPGQQGACSLLPAWACNHWQDGARPLPPRASGCLPAKACCSDALLSVAQTSSQLLQERSVPEVLVPGARRQPSPRPETPTELPSLSTAGKGWGLGDPEHSLSGHFWEASVSAGILRAPKPEEGTICEDRRQIGSVSLEKGIHSGKWASGQKEGALPAALPSGGATGGHWGQAGGGVGRAPSRAHMALPVWGNSRQAGWPQRLRLRTRVLVGYW